MEKIINKIKDYLKQAIEFVRSMSIEQKIMSTLILVLLIALIVILSIIFGKNSNNIDVDEDVDSSSEISTEEEESQESSDIIIDESSEESEELEEESEDSSQEESSELSESSSESSAESSTEESEEVTVNIEDCYIKNDVSNLDYVFPMGENVTLTSSVFYSITNADYCYIDYKTADEDIVSISSSGVALGNSLGTSSIFVCVVETATEEVVDYFELKIIIEYEAGSDKAIEDGQSLISDISGYYWYLDGYDYAYLYPYVINNNGTQALQWSSGYIDLKSSQFVTTEFTNVLYQESSNIYNTFITTSTDYVYTLIENYNMYVSGEKLYITIGGDTYSFTKSTSLKTIATEIVVDSTSVTVLENETGTLQVSLTPSYVSADISVSSSDTSILTCYYDLSQSGEIEVIFEGVSAGTTTITIKDFVSGASININATVNADFESLLVDE